MTQSIQEASRAVAEAVRLCRPKVIPIYPITPQTHNAEAMTEFAANGLIDAKIINVESEHSAMSAAIGSSATGVRTYTASSSQGLKYMSEMLFIAAGLRLPIVMMVANRTLSAPINIWNDHSDSIAERDSGWLQFYAESTQESVDRMIQAFKISEKVLIPSMICMDGFTLTHVFENVDMPSQEEVDSFLPPLKFPFPLDPKKPVTLGSVASPEYYMEIKQQQQDDILSSLNTIKQVQSEFSKKFKRNYSFFEGYQTKDAEKIIVCMGTICGTTRKVIDDLRKQGKKVGMIKISLFRPFPRKDFQSLISTCKKLKNLIILDRDISVGNKGVLFTEIRDVLFDQISNNKQKLNVKGYIAGLGGRDVTEKHIEKAFNLQEIEWLT
ncbi:MAG: pyruvate ferredoxin oxidoreductase [Candidatus Pacearchaeota archaeon]|jgi:pyruvate ferredoxin oxidoreductase alpha subunit